MPLGTDRSHLLTELPAASTRPKASPFAGPWVQERSGSGNDAKGIDEREAVSTLDVVSKLGRASATVEESHEVKKLCKGEVPYEKASVSGWMPLRCRETVRRVSEVRNRALARLKHFPPTPHPTPPPGFTIDWVVLRFAEVPLMLRCRCCRLRGRRAQPELEDRRPIEPQRAAVKAAFAFSQPTADSLSHAPQLGSLDKPMLSNVCRGRAWALAVTGCIRTPTRSEVEETDGAALRHQRCRRSAPRSTPRAPPSKHLEATIFHSEHPRVHRGFVPWTLLRGVLGLTREFLEVRQEVDLKKHMLTRSTHGTT